MAVVGLSRDPAKASHRVADYLQNNGYEIIPVNPTADKILGKVSYKSLLDISAEKQKKIEIVAIFRPPEDVPSTWKQVIQLFRQYQRPHVIWMQLGITNKEVAQKARKEGLTVIMNKCMMLEHSRLSEKNDEEFEAIRAEKIGKMLERAKSSGKLTTPITLTDSNFDENIQKHLLMLVDCWAPWCGPCRMIAPIIEELAKEYAGQVVFGKLNADENPATAKRYNIMGIPTLLIMRNEKEVDRIVGVAPKLMIENKLKKYI
ncbi:MAG: thioredoxin [Candidatus Bathyarchaeota archaeon]|nr:thioredoxin [Candidatus Bathyarchaeota archaeon]